MKLQYHHQMLLNLVKWIVKFLSEPPKLLSLVLFNKINYFKEIAKTFCSGKLDYIVRST